MAGIFLDSRPCTPDDPSVCGPEVGWATGASLLLATPVLLVLLPALGCLVGVLAGSYELVADRLPQAQAAFGLHGLACAVVLGRMLRSRSQQAAVVRAAAGSVAVPGPDTRPPRSGFVGAAALTAAAAGLLLLWHTWTAADQRHLAAAARLDATVVAELDDGYTVRLRLPDRQDEVAVDVVDSAYPVGAVLPVLVDRTGDEPWVALVAEQPDPTIPLAAGLAAAMVAVALAGREVARRRAPARLTAGAPAVAVLGVRRADEVDLWDADGSAPFARVPIRWTPGGAGAALAFTEAEEHWDEDDWDEDDWEAGQATAFGEAWREPGPSRDPGDLLARPEPMTAIGDLRQGGWVAVAAGTEMLWPAGGVRLLRGPGPDEPDLDDDEVFRGEPVVAGTGPVPDLPLTLRAPRSARRLGTALLAGFVLGPIAAVLFAESWYEHLLALWIGGAAGVSGLARLLGFLRLEPAGLTLSGRWRTHVVPWAALHGVRQDGPELLLAWWPEEQGRAGPFDPVAGGSTEGTAARAGTLAMRQRDRALAAGLPRSRVTSRWSPAMPAAGLYLVVALVVLVLE